MKAAITDPEIKTINDALVVLDSAAKKSREEVKNMITDDYQYLKQTFNELSPQVKSAFSSIGNQSKQMIKEAKDTTMATAKDSAMVVDRTVHQNPWSFIGGAVLAGGILGFLIANRRH